MKLWIEEDIGFVTVSGTMPIRVATPDEIKEAHPKCGECRHWGDGRYTTPIVDELPCALTYEPEFDGWDWTNGLTDYCNKWEAK